MIKYLFDYRTRHNVVFTKELLRDQGSCLDFWFNDCCRKDSLQNESLLNQSEAQEDLIDDCHLGENEKECGHQIFEFVEVFFFAVISYKSCEHVYIVNITEKGEKDEEINDRYGHSLEFSCKTFSLFAGDLLCEPGEIFKVFIDIENNLSMSSDAHFHW